MLTSVSPMWHNKYMCKKLFEFINSGVRSEKIHVAAGSDVIRKLKY